MARTLCAKHGYQYGTHWQISRITLLRLSKWSQQNWLASQHSPTFMTSCTLTSESSHNLWMTMAGFQEPLALQEKQQYIHTYINLQCRKVRVIIGRRMGSSPASTCLAKFAWLCSDWPTRSDPAGRLLWGIIFIHVHHLISFEYMPAPLRGMMRFESLKTWLDEQSFKLLQMDKNSGLGMT